MAFGTTRSRARVAAGTLAIGTLALALAACSSGGGGSSSSSAAPAPSSSSAPAPSSSSAPAPGEKIAVSLITKDSTNPFFVAMQEGAKSAATALGIDLTVASGKAEGDDAGQIAAIEAAVAANQAGILITPMSTGVNAALDAARAAGLYVIALDTPPDPADTVDITFATDNFEAGTLIGKWACANLKGTHAVIALLDIFDDKVVSVDYNRDNGFLTGMGIDVKDPKKMGDEAKTGPYKCWDGTAGDYEIVGNVATGANEEGGRTGMEQLLAKNADINTVYTINEPTAIGADAALKAAGKTGVLMVSVDGGRGGIEGVKSGAIGATSQQYPLVMADLGVKAIYDYKTKGVKPTTTPGLDFYNTGVTLITDKPVAGLDSKDSTYGLENAWG